MIVAHAEATGQGVEGDLEAVASAVGIGAVKYADLSNDRSHDYRFDWERMLSFDGNTAPYIQYAYARTRSIFRKAGEGIWAGATRLGFDAGLLLPPRDPAERDLAKRILGFGDAISSSLENYTPHKLCAYLFELAGDFTAFYERCPVLGAPSPEIRASRLALCALTGAVLQKGLEFLGIEAPERM